MNIFISFFNTVLYQPLFNGLVLLYQYLPGHDFGIAIIILTVIIRLALHPLMIKSLKSQKDIAKIQPKIQEIQQKFKDDKQKQAEEVMTLYKNEKINPLSGLVPLFVQLPLLIALYQVFIRGFQPESISALYSFVRNPGTLNPLFIGFINLSQGNVVLAAISAVMQFFQTKMMIPKKIKTKKKDQMAKMQGVIQKQMLYFFPVFTFFLLSRLPAAVAVYWITSSVFSIGQQKFLKDNDKSG